MKQNILVHILVILGLILATTAVYAEGAESLSTPALIEYGSNFSRATFQDTVQYQAMFSALSESCSVGSVAVAKSRYAEFISKEANQSSIYDANMFRSQRQFNTIKRLIIETPFDGSEVSCAQYYFLYTLLQDIQYLGRSITAPVPLLTLSHEVIELRTGNKNGFQYLAESYIQEHIRTLRAEGFLSDEDITNLDNRIHINYIDACGVVSGRYEMSQSAHGMNRQLNRIDINVNICYNDAYLTKIDRYIGQLFIHEMGHYLYYFLDTRSSSFDTICWIDARNICEPNEFISSYAKKITEEDYAESFAYWYLLIHRDPQSAAARRQDIALRSNRLLRKMDHFESLLDT